MRKLFLFLAAPALALSGCAGFSLAEPPSQYADRTILDERVAISTELAYQAAAVSFLALDDAGLLTPEQRGAAVAADKRAYAALQALRGAYDAGNAASYAIAADSARKAISDVLYAIRGV